MARKNQNVTDNDDWNDMYKDKDPSDWPGSDRPAKRPHPMHPDDRPSIYYKDDDGDPFHDRSEGSAENGDKPELLGP